MHNDVRLGDTQSMTHHRSAGVLLPVASLPDAPYCGDLGEGARRFVAWLADYGFDTWQLLPLHPTAEAFGYSPYAAQSAFAGDEMYVSVPDLPLTASQLEQVLPKGGKSKRKVDYASAKTYRTRALDLAFASISPAEKRDLAAWRLNNDWVEEYATWRVTADEQQSIHWPDWPADLRKASRRGGTAVDRVAYGQFCFARQWEALQRYATEQGVKLFGDLPIYPHLDSADVWAHQEIFKLTKTGVPKRVAGVPPDYFSEDGQLWGNPVYDWPKLVKKDFAWWVARIGHALRSYDLLRLDHFIGLVRAYEIKASAKTAKRGTYTSVPVNGLFHALREAYGELPIIAEDLGADLPEVHAAMAKWALPGMRVLQFGFGGGADNPHLPHNYLPNTVAYTGTHDNNTTRGWYDHDATTPARKHLQRYIGTKIKAKKVHRASNRLLLSSCSSLAIIPAQDVLGLGGAARTNMPGTTEGNWMWRAKAKELYAEKGWRRVGEELTLYGRDARVGHADLEAAEEMVKAGS